MKLFELFAVLSLQTAAFEKGMKSAVSIGNNTATKLTTTFQKATNAVERGLKVGAVALGTGFATLTKKALDFTGNLEQNLGGSEAVWGKYAETVQKAAKSAFGMAGLGTAEYLATANKMGSLFMGAGFETEEALDMTMNAMQRAADVAAIMGIDVEWAMESIAGAAKGNFTMMDNLGVAINDTTLAQYALSKGITKSTQAMTTQEKVALAMELFMERTAYAAGQYNRENETLAGSLTTAKAAFVNFLDGSGSVDDFVAATVNAGKVVTKNIVEIVPRLFTGLGKAAGDFIPYIEAAWVDIWDNKLPGIVTTGANSVIELINGVFGTNIPKIDKIDMPTVSDITSVVSDWWNGENGAKQKVSDLLDFSSIVATGIGEIGGNVYQWFIDNAESVSSALGTVGTALIVFSVKSSPGAIALALLSSAIVAFSTDWDDVKERFPDAVKKLEAFTGINYDETTKNLNILGESISSVGESLVGSFVGGLAWINDNNVGVVAGVTAIGVAFLKWLKDTHPYIMTLTSVITALGWLDSEGQKAINRSFEEHLERGYAVSATRYTEEDIKNLQRYIDAERELRKEQETASGGSERLEGLKNIRDYYFKLVRPYVNDSWNYAYDDLLATYEGWLEEKRINGLTDKYGLLDVMPELAPEAKDSLEKQLGDLSLTTSVNIVPIHYGGSGKRFEPVFGEIETPSASEVKTSTDLPGYATGLRYVPYDDFHALLHAGESVLTKQEAEEWRRSGSNAVSEPVDHDRLVAAFVEAMSSIRVQMDSREVGHMVAPTVSEDIGRNAKKNRFATA